MVLMLTSLAEWVKQLEEQYGTRLFERRRGSIALTPAGEVALQYAELDIAGAVLEQQQALLRLARRRLHDGIGTQLDVSQAEQPLAESRRQIDALHEAIVLSGHQLAVLAGQGPGAGERLRRPSLSLQRPPGLPAPHQRIRPAA